MRQAREASQMLCGFLILVAWILIGINTVPPLMFSLSPEAVELFHRYGAVQFQIAGGMLGFFIWIFASMFILSGPTWFLHRITIFYLIIIIANTAIIFYSLANTFIGILFIFASIVGPILLYFPLGKIPSELHIFDPKVLGIAKDYGGVITKSVVVYELKTSLETAGKCLERFVKEGEARKITAVPLTLYDFPSARTHLSRSDNTIVEVLRDNIRGMSRSSLLEATELTIEPLDEALKRLETKGIIIHDITTGDYKLKGVVMET